MFFFPTNEADTPRLVQGQEPQGGSFRGHGYEEPGNLGCFFCFFSSWRCLTGLCLVTSK